jgi:hypothetical protein
MLLTYFPVVRWHRRNPAFVLLLPFAALFYAYATVCSAINFWRGKGGRWKGRAQDIGRSGDREIESSGDRVIW